MNTPHPPPPDPSGRNSYPGAIDTPLVAPGQGPARAQPPRRFSQDLRDLADRFSNRRACLGDILAATQGRGFELLLLLIALPFISPIPLPGLSTPFGLVIVVIGARLALGRRPWLPRWLLQRTLPPRFITRVLAATSFVVRWLEVLLRPRLDFLHEQWIYRRVAGALITLAGALLLLPLPIPFTNTLPALTVVLLCAGAMERDGAFFLAGAAMALLMAAYFALIAIGGVQIIDSLRDRFFG